MSICEVRVTSRIIYHDGRDWIIEQRGNEYWSFPVDGEFWMQGLPPALSVEDVALIF
jgi:hypothetical protein